MLLSVSPRVAMCLVRAQEARAGIGVASNAEDRDFWHEMERRWMTLAHSYEIAERAETFLAEQRHKRLH
jgi:hypothetical protein